VAVPQHFLFTLGNIMSNKLVRIALLTALAAAGVGCNQQSSTGSATPAAIVAPSTPDGAISASVSALRNNNVAALLDNALPAAEVAKIKTEWHNDMTKDPVTDEERKQFADNMTKLTAPDAEAKMYAEIEPQLKEFDAKTAQQMPMMIAMGQSFAQSAIQQNKDMTDAQKTQAEALLAATAKWAGSVKFTDPALIKSAIAVICKTARALNLKSVDEARALSYDQAMQKAGIMLGGVKQVFAVYGLNMDKALESVKAETVATTGDTAKVKVTYTAFDQPFTTDSDLVRVDGKWYGKQALEQWKKKQQEDLAKAAAPATSGAQADAAAGK
jgi:hypothetical protein